jgi:hypothetical protein
VARDVALAFCTVCCLYAIVWPRIRRTVRDVRHGIAIARMRACSHPRIERVDLASEEEYPTEGDQCTECLAYRLIACEEDGIERREREWVPEYRKHKTWKAPP